MSNNLYRCVLDKDGYYKTLIMLISGNPYCYELQPGETLIEVDVPAAMYKPRWNGTDWEETATEEEIAAIEAARLEALL